MKQARVYVKQVLGDAKQALVDQTFANDIIVVKDRNGTLRGCSYVDVRFNDEHHVTDQDEPNVTVTINDSTDLDNFSLSLNELKSKNEAADRTPTKLGNKLRERMHDLHDGKNDIKFTLRFQKKLKNVILTTVLQEAKAHIFLWKSDARIVVTDVDGTITKSDLLGLGMQALGVSDWAHPEVSHVFSQITRNGYEVLFLSGRPRLEAKPTRKLLSNLYLYSGPLIVSPDGIIAAAKRQTDFLEHQSEFKNSMLEKIKSLFPNDPSAEPRNGRNPFFAAFGNTHSDAKSYETAGIPSGEIFHVNYPKDRIEAWFGSTPSKNKDPVISFGMGYGGISKIVTEIFPPLAFCNTFRQF